MAAFSLVRGGKKLLRVCSTNSFASWPIIVFSLSFVNDIAHHVTLEWVHGTRTSRAVTRGGKIQSQLFSSDFDAGYWNLPWESVVVAMVVEVNKL